MIGLDPPSPVSGPEQRSGIQRPRASANLHPWSLTSRNRKGQAFAGTKEFTRPDGKFYSEKFSGVISRNGEIIFADHDRNGISLGKLTGPDAMEIRYIEDGADAKVLIDLLNRQKS